jgi:subtilisin family serine protease
VYEGDDFVGESWDGGAVTALAPDPDPIDFEGHGTHIADIIAGNDGVAPGARSSASRCALRWERPAPVWL